MSRKAVSGIMLTLLLIDTLTLAFNIQTVKSSGTFYLRTNRCVDQPDLRAPFEYEKHITVSFDPPEIVKSGEYDSVRIRNCTYLSNPGCPQLPMKSVVIKLPLESNITNLEVNIADPKLLNGRYYVTPAQKPVRLDYHENGPNKIQPGPIYETIDSYPKEWFHYRVAKGLDPDTLKRVKYVCVFFYPVRYFPRQGKLWFAQGAAVTVSYSVYPKELSYNGGIDNLIVTSSDLEAEAIRFGQWKNSCGIISRVLNTTWIYAHYGGVDDPEKIRNCIIDFQSNFQTKFVTIFGDADKVPVRYVYVPDGHDTYVPTDLYYADLDYTWDDNGDGLYADLDNDLVDGIPDVYVGRIPPSLTEYAQTVVDKIKGYQQQFATSEEWTRRIVLAAGTGSPDGFTNPFGNATTVLKEYIADIASDKEIVKLYESAGNLSTDSMASEINKGALFVNFAGHGDPGTGLFAAGWLFYWIIPGLMWECFLISHVQSLTNGFKLPVVTTMACSTARFDDTDCIGECFVLEPDGGSIAYFGATRIAWGYSGTWAPHGLMGEMDRQVYEAFYEGYTRLGEMWGVSLTEYLQDHQLDRLFKDEDGNPIGYLNEKTVMEFILLGDPSLRIYNGPETLNVPEEYATIQGAINSAYDGDIIRVASGTYHEGVFVDKSVSLIGESRNNTTIDGEVIVWGTGTVVYVYANNVSITGFKIENGDVGIKTDWRYGQQVTITRNAIMNNVKGVQLVEVYNSTFADNVLMNNTDCAIQLSTNFPVHTQNNFICNNTITQNAIGIFLDNCGGNTLVNNTITHNEVGIQLNGSSNNTISGNGISNSDYGILLGTGSMPQIGFLYCNGFDSTYTDWTMVGSLPYLDTVDYPTNYLIAPQYAKTGYYSFGNLIQENVVIDNVTLEIYGKSGDTYDGDGSIDHCFKVYVWDGSWHDLGGNIYYTGGWEWKSKDASSYLDSVKKINDAKIYLDAFAGGYDLRYPDVDCARLKIKWYIQSSGNSIYHNKFINNTVQVYTEDFQDGSWVEQDPNNDITINNSTHVTVTTLNRGVDAWYYKDYGANYFSASEGWHHRFCFRGTGGNGGGVAVVYQITNSPNEDWLENVLNNRDYLTLWLDRGGPNVILTLGNSTGHSDSDSHSYIENNWYYVDIEYFSNGTCIAQFYSDKAYTDFLFKLTQTHRLADMRYCAVVKSYNSGDVGTVSFNVADLQFYVAGDWTAELWDSRNIWDNGYPSGGNYWSNYNGTDLYSGPCQNVTGSDGIGDTPYVIDANNQDNYPLMKPYSGLYDIGIIGIITSKAVVDQGYNLSITVKILNYGINSETFNVTAYANATVINQTQITLTSRNSTTLTFTWNTTGVAKGNYTITAYAEPVEGETDTTDNTLTDGWIMVTILGDVNGDREVDVYDKVIVGAAFGATYNATDGMYWHQPPDYTGPCPYCPHTPNADINNDGVVDIYDKVIVGYHFGETDP